MSNMNNTPNNKIDRCHDQMSILYYTLRTHKPRCSWVFYSPDCIDIWLRFADHSRPISRWKLLEFLRTSENTCKKQILTEKQANGKAHEKLDFLPDSGTVDTYARYCCSVMIKTYTINIPIPINSPENSHSYSICYKHEASQSKPTFSRTCGRMSGACSMKMKRAEMKERTHDRMRGSCGRRKYHKPCTRIIIKKLYSAIQSVPFLMAHTKIKIKTKY